MPFLSFLSQPVHGVAVTLRQFVGIVQGVEKRVRHLPVALHVGERLDEKVVRVITVVLEPAVSPLPVRREVRAGARRATAPVRSLRS